MLFSQIRAQALEHLKGKWGIAILAMIIANLIANAPNMLVQLNNYEIIQIQFLLPILRILSFISLVLLPVIVGYNRVHLDIAEELEPDLDRLYYGFKDGNFGRSLLALFMQRVFMILWYICFIIPGIIKTFSYAMTSYILADPRNIHLEGLEPITESRRLMDGHKMEFFLLILSTIWWMIPLSMVFGAIAAISGYSGALFYFFSSIMLIASFLVGPYVEQVSAEFYITLTKPLVTVSEPIEGDPLVDDTNQPENAEEEDDDPFKYY